MVHLIRFLKAASSGRSIFSSSIENFVASFSWRVEQIAKRQPTTRTTTTSPWTTRTTQHLKGTTNRHRSLSFMIFSLSVSVDLSASWTETPMHWWLIRFGTNDTISFKRVSWTIDAFLLAFSVYFRFILRACPGHIHHALLSRVCQKRRTSISLLLLLCLCT